MKPSLFPCSLQCSLSSLITIFSVAFFFPCYLVLSHPVFIIYLLFLNYLSLLGIQGECTDFDFLFLSIQLVFASAVFIFCGVFLHVCVQFNLSGRQSTSVILYMDHDFYLPVLKTRITTESDVRILVFRMFNNFVISIHISCQSSACSTMVFNTGL